MNRPRQRNTHCGKCGTYRWCNFIANRPYCRDCLVVYIGELRTIMRKIAARCTSTDLTDEETAIVDEVVNPYAEV